MQFNVPSSYQSTFTFDSPHSAPDPKTPGDCPAFTKKSQPVLPAAQSLPSFPSLLMLIISAEGSTSLTSLE